jgi:hypothetical protein
MRGWLGAFLIFITGATSAAAQVADSARAATRRIIGVFDAEAGTPLEGVRIVDAFSGSYVLTTQTGTARLDFLTFRGAAAFVELRKLGYEPKQIVVSRADTLPITETMQRLTILPQVTTTAKYRIDRDPGRWDSFEDRCRTGSGTCIRSQDLEQRPAANIADFLIRAPGVTMGGCSAVSGRNAQCGHIAMKPTVIPPAFCLPTFFVDGIEWSPTMGPPVDLTPGRAAEGLYTPNNVKAVEIYPPERNRPLRFTGDPTCGAIVIWTK